MRPLSTDFLASMQRASAAAMPDDCEIRPVRAAKDYGSDVESYPPSGHFVKGALQYVPRVPGTPEVADQSVATGNFIVKLPVGVGIERGDDGRPTKECRIVVNGGASYQVEVVHNDKSNALLIDAYCYEVH